MKRWIKKGWLLPLLFVLLLSSIGCGVKVSEDEANDTKNSQGENSQNENGQGVKKADPDYLVFEDNLTLYENEDDTSVVTMYLTVRKGNESESTNHTWKEVNSRSVYDYEEMGVERYGVEGLLQVGDENGPLVGELGYGLNAPNATVTIRGQTSSRNAQKSYRIKIKDNKEPWRQQRTVNLNKHMGDGVRFRNKLAYHLMEGIPGLVSSQTQFVHLYVKDQTEGAGDTFVDYGLYTHVEQPNKTFLKRHGLDSEGHLYKINSFEFYRYEDVIKLNTDPSFDQKAFEERIEIKGNDDNSKLIAMLEELNDTSIPIEEIMEKWFDEENMLAWLSFQILSGNTDTQSRNTLIYSPVNINKWYFIAWDCDAAFMAKQFEIQNRSEKESWEVGISNYWGNVLFQRVLKDEGLRKKLDEEINEQRELLNEDRLTELVDGYQAVTKSYAYSPADILNAPLTQEQFDEVCRAIPKEVEENYQNYLESLEKPMPFYIGVPTNEGGKISFVWDNSYDFDAEDVHYTFELADNLEFTNPIAVGESLFMPEYTYEGILPAGQYFMRVKAKNESQKEQYAFDYYVLDNTYKIYGTRCFYVNADGSILEDTYEE